MFLRKYDKTPTLYNLRDGNHNLSDQIMTAQNKVQPVSLQGDWSDKQRQQGSQKIKFQTNFLEKSRIRKFSYKILVPKLQTLIAEAETHTFLTANNFGLH